MEMHLITSWYSRRRPGKFATIRKVQLLKVIDNRVTPEIELRARNYPIDEETLRVARETPHLVPQYIKDHPEKNLIFFGENSPHPLQLKLDRILNHPETSNVLRNKESLTLKMKVCEKSPYETKIQLSIKVVVEGWYADDLYHYSMDYFDANSNTKLFSIKDFTTKKGWDFGTFMEDLRHFSPHRRWKCMDPQECLDNCKSPFRLEIYEDRIVFTDIAGSGI